VRRAWLVVLLACSGERTATTTRSAHVDDAPIAARGDASKPDAAQPVAAQPVPALPDAVTAPVSLDAALTILRARELAAPADAIARRVAQRARKMKLSMDDALAAAQSLLELADRAPIRALAAVMPRSTVELARAVHGRGVSVAEAERIASYLGHVADTLAFERLHVFDDNHSHVTGRDWHEIDYSGEGMTWQGQRDYWTPRGVQSFKRAAYIHAYFVGAEKLPHWRRVYRPRGKMAAVAPPR
jgi:hypothetical protein